MQSTRDHWKKYRELAAKSPHKGDRFKIDRTLPVRQVQDHPVYAGLIESMDSAVGTVMECLKAQGLDDNTVIIFTGDNGPWLSYGTHAGSALPLREGKGTMFDGGCREACIMRWPGAIPPEQVCGEIASVMDIFPTFAALSGADFPTDRKTDGKDIWPLLSGQPDAVSPHSEYFHYFRGNLTAVRSGKWKLSRPKRGEAVWSLYDLEADIGESKDVKAEHPEVVERLEKLLTQMRADLGDNREPGPNSRPLGTIELSK